MGEAKRLDPLVINAIKKLRASGKFKVAALTNNYTPAEGAEKGESVLSSSNPENVELRTLFHEFVESSKTGMRKPNPQIYIYTCDSVGVKPHEAIFLDDPVLFSICRKLGSIVERRKYMSELFVEMVLIRVSLFIWRQVVDNQRVFDAEEIIKVYRTQR